MPDPFIALLLVAAGLATGALVRWRVARSSRGLGTATDRATYETLHRASQAALHLRSGLTNESARKAAHPLRTLLGTPALAVVSPDGVLAWDGIGEAHATRAAADAASTLAEGGATVLGPGDPGRPADERLRHAAVAPITSSGLVVGALVAYAAEPSAALVRAVEEVAGFASTQLELGELDRSRARLMEAEVRALRAQISPHFVYNALTAIASFVRTDPERARDLLTEFADFTRYSFRRHGDFTTLAEELRSIDRYLTLERARFGDRLRVTVRVAPEVLPVAVPFLCVQPLVENAVQHGLEGRAGPGTVTLVAEDAGAECHISVEDDGVGMDPEALRGTLSGETPSDSVGLTNVDERLRAVYGDAYGLVVETAPGMGTRVSLRIPKYRAGVHAS